VVTPVQKVFISIGIGKISMEGMGDFYAISASVPFAQAVKEKKAGDTVVFNGKKLEILEVY
jgi:transcription elongation GreA/GreB family factor